MTYKILFQKQTNMLILQKMDLATHWSYEDCSAISSFEAGSHDNVVGYEY